MATTTKSSTSKTRKKVLTPGKAQTGAKTTAAPVPLKAVATPAKTAATRLPKSGDPEAALVLRKPELVQRVVAASGLKKRDAKAAVEATLMVLGRALEAGEELNLHPLGKVMVKRRRDRENAEVLTARIRRRKT